MILHWNKQAACNVMTSRLIYIKYGTILTEQPV